MNEVRNNSSIFDRSGLAALSDLETEEWKNLFAFLEKEQNEFLSKDQLFRSPEYKWPRDPLHTWSRVWEYPYVYHHLSRVRQRFVARELPIVLDFGSGVTFFPFTVAKLGYRVICADIDSVSQKDLGLAVQYIPHNPGSIDLIMINGDELPFANDEVDIVYCISVLEHVPDCERAVSELWRILKRGGLFFLTIDLDIRGDFELGVPKYRRLMKMLSLHFDFVWPVVTIHPSDILVSNTGPFGLKKPQGVRLSMHFFKQRVIKPIFGRRSTPLLPYHLTVEGIILRKR
jgi:2-polyprenyl-3-methyl-5-hydroxy-6-metoxy-1,4-benzoquinol methylase